MRRFAVLFGLAFLCLVLFAVGVHSSDQGRSAPPVVKVVLSNGHGSGVHIGSGYIITAAHVVGKETSVTVKTSDGVERKATVLWASAVHDIAMLKIVSPYGVQSARLACVVPATGTLLIAAGNPLAQEFLDLRGYVAGTSRELGPWKVAVPVDLTMVGGMSGGPVYDMRGRVVGITVGHLVVPIGIGASWLRIGAMVPGKIVCDLMGRSS